MWMGLVGTVAYGNTIGRGLVLYVDVTVALFFSVLLMSEEEPSKETDTSRECLLRESNAGEVLQGEGYCDTKEGYSPERDSCLEGRLSSSQCLGINNEALEQPSPDVIMGTLHHKVNEEPSECVKGDTMPMTASSSPVLLQSQESLANTTPG